MDLGIFQRDFLRCFSFSLPPLLLDGVHVLYTVVPSVFVCVRVSLSFLVSVLFLSTSCVSAVWLAVGWAFLEPACSDIHVIVNMQEGQQLSKGSQLSPSTSVLKTKPPHVQHCLWIAYNQAGPRSGQNRELKLRNEKDKLRLCSSPRIHPFQDLCVYICTSITAAHVFPQVGLGTAKRGHSFLQLIVLLLRPRPPVEHLALRRGCRRRLFRRPTSHVGGGRSGRRGQEVAVQRAGCRARLLPDPANIGRRARGVVVRSTGGEEGSVFAGRPSLYVHTRRRRGNM